MAPDVLIVFVKEPRKGTVKTRLSSALGPARAAELYRVLAEEEVRRTRPARGDYERLFFFTPAAARPALAEWFPGETLLPQEGADLGARMAHAFEVAFGRGAPRAAVIGTDVPWVSRQLVKESLLALDDHEVVAGPARDGGYYLLALDRPRPQLFEGIPWSTPAVLRATAERARLLGLRLSVLEPLADIDTIEDVRREWRALRPLLDARPDLVTAIERALSAAPPAAE
ncbi:MAG TPA: TIGR04282 family arsenosugar biosynthesis glycosyltransferase [Vicinamibacteria bacterium]|nr:TIGR04282 family arsenosugar biosynthesis glycosyltransferase [Vicinamibacteria bacterium]